VRTIAASIASRRVSAGKAENIVSTDTIVLLNITRPDWSSGKPEITDASTSWFRVAAMRWAMSSYFTGVVFSGSKVCTLSKLASDSTPTFGSAFAARKS
jgi:hypothetical protein